MASSQPSSVSVTPLPPFKPDLYQRAWSSIPHPTLPLLATCHAKAVTIFSLSTLTKHSSLSGGHTRSVRCAAWKPGLPPGKLCLVTGSFDATAGLWRWEKEAGEGGEGLEVDVTKGPNGSRLDTEKDASDDDWEFTLVLEGHENEIKSVSFSPSGQYLATCSRDKTVWIWEDVGVAEDEDEWETVAVLSEHDGDIKAVAWCPDVPGRNKASSNRHGSLDVLASASYDNTVRIWREDGDGEWVCVSVLEGHEETVWGLQFEPKVGNEAFPRLMSFSADGTVRIWTLQVEEEEETVGDGGDGNNPFRSAMSGIPNTMRRGLREDWVCTAVLPKAHTRDIYSASWSGDSGLIASTGSDGLIVVYGEEKEAKKPGISIEDRPEETGEEENTRSRDGWRILGTVSNGHGAYEINHVTWCKRYDAGAEQKGIEEMLVTTGDDGVIRPWQIKAD